MQRGLLFFFLLASLFSAAQPTQDCEPDVVYAVIAPSGLRMRSKPTTQSAVVVTVPYDSLVIACTETFGAFNTKDAKGYWRFVQYKEYQGFMFDGYLIPRNRPEQKRISSLPNSKEEALLQPIDSAVEEIIPTPPTAILPPVDFTLATETYNYCGGVEALNPGLNWYGIYPPDPLSSEYRMEKVNVMIVLSQQRMSEKMEFDIRTDREEKSIFLIGSAKPLDRGTVLYLTEEMQNTLPLSLYPGQSGAIFARAAAESPQNIQLEALGSVTAGGDCPTLSNYQLLIATHIGQEKVQQEVASMVRMPNACGVPELLWFGDINADGYADALWASRTENSAQFTLVVSQLTEDTIWVLADTWNIESCD